MKVLIDTHIFLWFYLEPHRIKQNAKDFLEDTVNNEIFVSYVTAWEISIKHGIGKLKIPDIPEMWVPDRIRRGGFTQLSIKMQHALRVHNLPPIHKDPFDRMLISQANFENLTIVTQDPNFSKYQVKTSNLNSL